MRNEAHSGFGGPLFQNNMTGHASFFEYYIDARAKGDRIFSRDGATVKNPAPLEFGSYPAPAFHRFSNYWSSGQGESSLIGTGLADYSNHGFLTAAKNIGNTEYANPSPDPNAYEREKVTTQTWLGKLVIMNYLKKTVPDHNIGIASAPIRMARESSWSFFSNKPAYTLDVNTYDDMTKLLIPNAVGYSAGILNYFFRGSMKVDLPDDGIYGTCREKEEKIVVSAPLDAVVGSDTGSAQTFTFDFSDKPIPVNAMDLFLQVVYRGALGQEADAVAVATKDILEPSPFNIQNDLDYYINLSYPDQNGYNIDPNAPKDQQLQRREDLAFSSAATTPTVQTGILDPGQFMRVMVLAEPGAFTTPVSQAYDGYGVPFTSSLSTVNWDGAVNQQLTNGQGFSAAPYFATRFGWDRFDGHYFARVVINPNKPPVGTYTSLKDLEVFYPKASSTPQTVTINF